MNKTKNLTTEGRENTERRRDISEEEISKKLCLFSVVSVISVVGKEGRDRYNGERSG
jgi:hypothetical protein